MAIDRSFDEAAQIIDNFLEGRGGPSDWDDFISVRCRNPIVEDVRLRCIALPDEYPPDDDVGYCSPAREEILRQLAAELRKRT